MSVTCLILVFFWVILFLFHTLATTVLGGPVAVFVPCGLDPVVVGVVAVFVAVLDGGGGHGDVRKKPQRPTRM